MNIKTRARPTAGEPTVGGMLEEASKMLHSCPGCGKEISTRALVEAFGEPDGWAFYGERGARWIVCRGQGYVHFRVQVRGVEQHRLAVITNNTGEH